MTVNDFLAHAEEMARDGRPAWCRSAVSRAYYAAHHAAVDFLFRGGVRTQSGGTRHVATFNALVGVDDVDDPTYQAGLALLRLHDKRNRADYDWKDLALERQDRALALVDAARQIVTALDECLGDPDRADAVWEHFRRWVPAHGPGFGLTLV